MLIARRLDGENEDDVIAGLRHRLVCQDVLASSCLMSGFFGLLCL